MEEELLEAFVRLAQIYSPEPLTREQIIEKGKEYKQKCQWKDLDNGFRSYLRLEFNLPLNFGEEILKLDRRLSALEMEALCLDRKIKERKEKGIKIIIYGL